MAVVGQGFFLRLFVCLFLYTIFWGQMVKGRGHEAQKNIAGVG